MKKFILLLILLVTTAILNAQTVLKTYKNQLVKKENNVWVTKFTNFETMTIMLYDNLVIVKDDANSMYKTYGEPYKKNEKDAQYIYYNAVDENYTDCTVVVMKPYSNKKNSSIVVMYDEVWFIYYLKNI